MDINIREHSLRLLDHRFADWVVQHFGQHLPKEQQALLARLVRAVSYATHLKHTCLDLHTYTGLEDPVLTPLLDGITPATVKALLESDRLPLRCSADGRRVWLQKYHAFEQACAEHLLALASQPLQPALPKDALGHGLSEEQQIAAQMAWSNGLAVITGGPGTGKTFTVGRIMALLLAQHPDLRIELAAPTGKAGQRMTESIRAALGVAMPTGRTFEARTLHSLLGIGHGSPKPRYHRDKRLPFDILIVDEASMIDLPMMHRLLDAMPGHARLILLGDKDQLASVEAGNVLAELCQGQALQHCTVNITQSRRFDGASDIGRLAAWLNDSRLPTPNFAGQQVRVHIGRDANPWQPRWLQQALDGYRPLQQAIGYGLPVVDVLQQQQAFQLLCALRQGPAGVEGINRLVEDALGQNRNAWYAGKPLIILQNDRAKKLFNGDVGLVLPLNADNTAIEPDSSNLKACFLTGDSSFRTVSQAQLPPHETCYALTVHKSQGSEYRHVLIVLPDDVADVTHNPVLTRELAYTAVTRAKEQADIFAGAGVLETMAGKQTVRMSGLAAMLGPRE